MTSAEFGEIYERIQKLEGSQMLEILEFIFGIDFEDLPTQPITIW